MPGIILLLFSMGSCVVSDRMKSITSCKSFPLSQETVKAFESLKKIIEEAVITAIDKSAPFEVETDASDVALAAIYSQSEWKTSSLLFAYSTRRMS